MSLGSLIAPFIFLVLGNWNCTKEDMSKANKGKKKKRSRKQTETQIEKMLERMAAYRLTGKKPR